MRDHSFPFLVLPAPRLPQRTRTATKSAVFSILAHATVAAALALLIAVPNNGPPQPSHRQVSTKPEIPRLVFLQMPGPGGGGGGGGNRQPSPPSRAHAIGRDQITVPVARRLTISPEPDDVVAPPQVVVLQAVPLAAGASYQIGMPDASPSLLSSQGPGEGGGTGGGSGSGIGSGTGPGYGPGSGGGFGGNVYRPGNGVIAPTILLQVNPLYTSDAMHRKIQGTVVLEAVVTTDGLASSIRVVRSLDAYGLDQEAVRAVNQWRFMPGRMGGTPVNVLVLIELAFHIR